MSDQPRDLETALADLREEAVTLRRARVAMPPDRVEEWADIVERAAEEWLTWLSEGDASMRAGKSTDWVRGRYEQLHRDGHARTVNGKRQYRSCFIPRHANADTAAQRGREAAREAREQKAS
jgi:hypothetical protein